MKIERKRLSDIRPLENNVRIHGEVQIKEMMRALDQFGQTRPFVLDDGGNILIGNCMYAAMMRIGTEMADCITVRGLSDKKKKKLILSDNKMYRLGADNFEMIDQFLKDIASDGDYEIPGFDSDVVKRLFDDIKDIDVKIQDYGNVDSTSFSVQNEHVPQNPPASPEGNADIPQPRQYTICPKCGEMIYLD